MAVPQSRSQREVLNALADVITVDPSARAPPRAANGFDNSAASFAGKSPMAATDTQPAVPTKDSFDPVGPTSRHRTAPNTMAAPPPPAKGAFGRFAQAFRRSNTENADKKQREKERRMQQRARNEPSRIDVIDRMDLSGIGTSLFHHDSPYDACSPHSNRNQRRAPVKAFDETIDPMTGQPIGHGRAVGNGSSNARGQGLSPLAAATMRKMSDNVGGLPGDGKNDQDLLAKASSRNPTTQMPLLGRNGTASTLATNATSTAESEHDDVASNVSHGSAIDRDVDVEHAYRNNRGYFAQPSNVSRGRADNSNPNADIWGVSSEPWQDFAQPTNRLDVPRGSGDGLQSSASSVFDMEAVMTGKPAASRPGNLSPGSPEEQVNGNPNAPKRNKSLIKRIKNARQYGNVPPPDDDVVDRAEAKAATGRQQRRLQHQHSPSTPPLERGASPQFEAAGATGLGRSGTLKAGSGNGYAAEGGISTAHNNGSSTGLGRSGSIFGRMRNGKNRERDAAVAR